MYSTSRFNNPTYLCGPSKYPVSREAIRAQNGKLRKYGRTYRLGTVFAPRKYLYQKEATGMERPEMYSATRCNNPTYLCGPSKYTVSREAVLAQNGKLRKLGRTYRHCTVFATRKYLYQKEATGMERPEMYSASRCNNPTITCEGLQNTPSRGRRYGTKRTYRYGTVFAPRKY